MVPIRLENRPVPSPREPLRCVETGQYPMLDGRTFLVPDAVSGLPARRFSSNVGAVGEQAMTPRICILENDAWQVGLLPEAGASVAFGRIRAAGGEWKDFLRPTPESSYGQPDACASYVLLPWSNRIRAGKFVFRGVEHQLRVNFPDGTAIHGTAREHPWRVVVAESKRFVATLDSTSAQRPNWPFPFSCGVEVTLNGNLFTTSTWLKNEGTAPFCAGFGHHPYFQRTILGEGDNVQLELPCSHYYVTEACIPSAAAIPVESRVDFRAQRPLGTQFVDDCLTGRQGQSPARFSYEKSGARIEMTMDDIYSHVVLYIPLKQSFFAVEPVTHANDGFNLCERAVPGTGVFVLEAGQEARGKFALRLIAGPKQ